MQRQIKNNFLLEMYLPGWLIFLLSQPLEKISLLVVDDMVS